MPKDKLRTRFNFRLSKADMHLIIKGANKAGVRISKFIRNSTIKEANQLLKEE